MDRVMKWICFSTSRRNQLREISDRVEAGRKFDWFSLWAAAHDNNAALSFFLLTSSEGPDDTTAVTKC